MAAHSTVKMVEAILPLVASAFWTEMEMFHVAVHGDCPNGREGLLAFRYFRSLLERNWVDGDTDDHPFRDWVRIASEYHYARLIELRRRFELVDKINCFEERAVRLADKKEYLGARAEIEMAARLRMAGVEISFLKNEPVDTPDLLATVVGRDYWVEVTCVNPAPLEYQFSDLMGEIMRISMKMHVAIGGFGLQALTKQSVVQIADELKLAAGEIAGKNELRKVNVPGKATLYVGSGTGAAGIPEEYRGSFRTWEGRSRPHVERVIGKIREKGGKDYLGGDSGFLVLHDSLMDPKSIDEIFSDKTDDLGLVMATYPQILGMALVVPSEFGNRVSPVIYMPTHDRAYEEYALPDMTAERLIVWRNGHTDAKLPLSICSAFRDYPANYKRILP